MKYKTYVNILGVCLSLYKESKIRDTALENAFGGSSKINSGWLKKHINSTLGIISKEYGREDLIKWLFWESMVEQESKGSYLENSEEDVKYLGNPKNVYLVLNGLLSQSDSLESLNSHISPTTPTIPKGIPQETKTVKHNNQESTLDKIVRYFESLAVEVEVGNEDSLTLMEKNNIIIEYINKENLYEEMKTLSYEHQLFSIILYSVDEEAEKYKVTFEKINPKKENND